MKLSNKMYDVLKWVVIIVLPAISALYSGLAGVWGGEPHTYKRLFNRFFPSEGAVLEKDLMRQPKPM